MRENESYVVLKKFFETSPFDDTISDIIIVILDYSAGNTAVAAAAAATSAAAAAGGKDRRHLNGQSVRQHPYPRT